MARPGFDALTLRALVHELKPFVGGRLQGVRQPDELQIVFDIYRAGQGEARWLFDCSPQWARTHLIQSRVPNAPSPPAFCAALRKFIESGTILSMEQRGFDRILDVEVRGHEGHQYLLTAEFMGRHSNLILLGPEENGQRVILHAAKLIPARLSRVREVLPGRVYIPPPAPKENGFALSPILKVESALREDDSIEQAAHSNQWEPVSLRDENNQIAGAYPLPLKSWKGTQEPRGSLSLALEEYYSFALPRAELENEKRTLGGLLNKAWEQRAQALTQMEHGQYENHRAVLMRHRAELIVANLWQLENGQASAVVTDYYQYPPGEITIELDPDLSPQENANRLFERARHGEKSAARLKELQQRMQEEFEAIEKAQEQLQKATTLEEIVRIREDIATRGWLQSQQAVAGKDSIRADFGGKKIRSYTSPEGWQVLVGDNADANDYLVQRLGQSNDWWLHLRAGTSAHALVKTNNAPLKVPKSTLEFAARLVVQRSAAKHAGIVAVDYTLKKYVRKPRRAAPGSVLYSHEKTLHVGAEA